MMQLTAIDLLSLPSLTLSDKAQLPRCAAIYFVLDGNTILYIGRTKNLTQRWAGHHRLKQLKRMNASLRIAWLECSNPDLLFQIEKVLTQRFSPSLNDSKREDGLPRVAIYLPEVIKSNLERLANTERRSVSQMAALLIEESIARAKTEGRLKPDESSKD